MQSDTNSSSSSSSSSIDSAKETIVSSSKRTVLELVSCDNTSTAPRKRTTSANNKLLGLSNRGLDYYTNSTLLLGATLHETLLRRLALPSNVAFVSSGARLSSVLCASTMRNKSSLDTVGCNILVYICRYLSLNDMVVLCQISITMNWLVRDIMLREVSLLPPQHPRLWTKAQQFMYEKVVDQGQCVFVTGEAGTGKSRLIAWFVRYIMAFTTLNIRCVASTGIAAVPLYGQTLHSFIGLRPDVILPEDSQAPKNHEARPKTCQQLEDVDILVLEEVPMCSPQLIHYLDVCARKTRKNNSPFGGIHMVFVGDFTQLPPVKGNGKYAFDGNIWKRLFEAGNNVLYLNKIFRQREPAFINMLRNIRSGTVNVQDTTLLHSRVPQALETVLVPTGKDATDQIRDTYIDKVLAVIDAASTILTGRRDTAKKINIRYLAALPAAIHTWTATDIGEMGKANRTCLPKHLKLKVGATVLLTTNSYIFDLCSNMYLTNTDTTIDDSNSNKKMLPNGCGGHVVKFITAFNEIVSWMSTGLVVESSQKCEINGIMPNRGTYTAEFGAKLTTYDLLMKHITGMSERLHLDEQFKFSTDCLPLVCFEDHGITAMVLPMEARVYKTVPIEASKLSEYTKNNAAYLSAATLRPLASSLYRSDQAGSAYKNIQVCSRRRLQIPLRLGRAITAHKSQGMTLPKVAINLAECFELGHPYVLISRATNLAGLTILNHHFGANLLNRLSPKRAVEYYKTLLAAADVKTTIV